MSDKLMEYCVAFFHPSAHHIALLSAPSSTVALVIDADRDITVLGSRQLEAWADISWASSRIDNACVRLVSDAPVSHIVLCASPGSTVTMVAPAFVPNAALAINCSDPVHAAVTYYINRNLSASMYTWASAQPACTGAVGHSQGTLPSATFLPTLQQGRVAVTLTDSLASLAVTWSAAFVSSPSNSSRRDSSVALTATSDRSSFIVPRVFSILGIDSAAMDIAVTRTSSPVALSLFDGNSTSPDAPGLAPKSSEFTSLALLRYINFAHNVDFSIRVPASSAVRVKESITVTPSATRFAFSGLDSSFPRLLRPSVDCSRQAMRVANVASQQSCAGQAERTPGNRENAFVTTLDVSHAFCSLAAGVVGGGDAVLSARELDSTDVGPTWYWLLSLIACYIAAVVVGLLLLVRRGVFAGHAVTPLVFAACLQFVHSDEAQWSDPAVTELLAQAFQVVLGWLPLDAACHQTDTASAVLVSMLAIYIAACIGALVVFYRHREGDTWVNYVAECGVALGALCLLPRAAAGAEGAPDAVLAVVGWVVGVGCLVARGAAQTARKCERDVGASGDKESHTSLKAARVLHVVSFVLAGVAVPVARFVVGGALFGALCVVMLVARLSWLGLLFLAASPARRAVRAVVTVCDIVLGVLFLACVFEQWSSTATVLLLVSWSLASISVSLLDVA